MFGCENRLSGVRVSLELGVKGSKYFFGLLTFNHLLGVPLEEVPYLNIILKKHLVLLHELYRYAKVLGHTGADLADGTQFISHDGQHLPET